MRIARKLFNLVRSPWIAMGLLIVLAGLTAARIFFASSSRRRAEDPAVMQKTAAGKNVAPAAKEEPARIVTRKFGQDFADFVLPPEKPEKKEAGPPPLPEEVTRKLINASTAISLFPPSIAASKAPAAPPTYYLPSFRVIRCELVAAPETGNIETPLIGVVIENQYEIDADGVTRLVLPAGVEVHGVGKVSPIRDRIDGNGKWTFVWRSRGAENGMELSVNALALNRDYDEAKGVYGDLEKSPGIVGRRFQSGGDKAIEEVLLSAVAAMTRNLKSYTSVLNPLTDAVLNQQKPTVGNALLEGASAGTDRIAAMVDDVRKEIDEKGYYVAVLPGKEFYLYTKEPVDLRKAHRPGAAGGSEGRVSTLP